MTCRISASTAFVSFLLPASQPALPRQVQAQSQRRVESSSRPPWPCVQKANVSPQAAVWLSTLRQVAGWLVGR